MQSFSHNIEIAQPLGQEAQRLEVTKGAQGADELKSYVTPVQTSSSANNLRVLLLNIRTFVH